MSLGYTKLFNTLITSTVWQESNPTRIVWITMLAIKDRSGTVRASIPGLASLARVTIDECIQAIKRLSEPDPYSSSKNDEGRRICEIDGGWKIINHQKYRDLLSEDDRRAYKAAKQAEYRAKDAEKSTLSTSGHSRHIVSVSESVQEERSGERESTPKPKPERDVEFPSTLSTSEFRGLWADYVAYRRESKFKALKPRSIAAQLAHMAEWGHDAACESIRQTIRNSWQGLFEPKERPRDLFDNSSKDDGIPFAN